MLSFICLQRICSLIPFGAFFLLSSLLNYEPFHGINAFTSHVLGSAHSAKPILPCAPFFHRSIRLILPHFYFIAASEFASQHFAIAHSLALPSSAASRQCVFVRCITLNDIVTVFCSGPRCCVACDEADLEEAFSTDVLTVMACVR